MKMQHTFWVIRETMENLVFLCVLCELSGLNYGFQDKPKKLCQPVAFCVITGKAKSRDNCTSDLAAISLNSLVQATDITEYTENMEVMPRFKGSPKE